MMLAIIALSVFFIVLALLGAFERRDPGCLHGRAAEWCGECEAWRRQWDDDEP
jgi:hypothetical protein